MKLAVVGSRTFTDADMMNSVLMEYLALYRSDLTIVSGGAEGADTLSKAFAGSWDTPMVIFKPDWASYGKSAGFIRNQLIVDEADALLAFYGPEGESKGTAHSVKMAIAKGIPTYIYYQQEGEI